MPAHLNKSSFNASFIRHLVKALGEIGRDDIAWSENIQPPASAEDFAQETIFVICNSGMKNTVARGIFDRVMAAVAKDKSAATAFGHAGKTAAIDTIWADRRRLFDAFLAAQDKLEFCAGLPFIGAITKYHLAKNFGVDCAKPDVHLQRLADMAGRSVAELCSTLAKESGYRIATIDLILWRACALGIVNSRAGTVNLPL